MTDLRTVAQLALEALERGETKLRYAAITALKAALAEPQSTHSDTCYKWHHECAVAEVNRLRAALAEPVQEPVAWGVFEGENLHDFFTLREEAEKMAGYKGPHATVMPLYTTPPQRPFVGLTVDERRGIREWKAIQKELGPEWAPMMLYLYEAIEAALREKNT